MTATRTKKPAAAKAEPGVPALPVAPPITCDTGGCDTATLNDWSYAASWHEAVDNLWQTDATGQRRCPACAKGRLPSAALYVTLPPVAEPEDVPDAAADAEAFSGPEGPGYVAMDRFTPMPGAQEAAAAFLAGLPHLPPSPASVPDFDAVLPEAREVALRRSPRPTTRRKRRGDAPATCVIPAMSQRRPRRSGP